MVSFFFQYMLHVLSIIVHRWGIQIELDSGERLVIPESLAPLYHLKQGMAIDATMYQQLKDEAERLLCRQKALGYLAMRARTVREMDLYLQRKKFSIPIIREILAGLKDAGHLDDNRFAREYITGRNNRELVGKNLIKSELSRKGVDRGTVSRAFSELPSLEVDIEAVYERALKKYEQLRGKKNRREKVLYFLQRKGFDHGIIRAVAQRLRSEDD